MLLVSPLIAIGILRRDLSMESIGVRPVEITPGIIIIYKLRRDQKPRQPEKEWRGKVLHYNGHLHRAVVKSLEEGYEECEDDVWLEQIIRIEDHDNI
jgi:hypothetical protein